MNNQHNEQDEALTRLHKINGAMDLLTEYLKTGGADDMRVLNTWLGEQAEIAKTKQSKALWDGKEK